MVKAIVKSGVIIPKAPLPLDWTEGTEVDVEKQVDFTESNSDLDRWYAELETIAAEGDPIEDHKLDAALREIRQSEKERARKKMDLAK